jgi:pimeloyl-ACP methyl ester carboxylesterase
VARSGERGAARRGVRPARVGARALALPRAAVLGVLLLLGTGGCFFRVLRDKVQGRQAGVIEGVLDVPKDWEQATVVALAAEPGRLSLEAAWPTFRPGRFTLVLPPGTYAVAAFRGAPGSVPSDAASWAAEEGTVAVHHNQRPLTAPRVTLRPRGAAPDPLLARLRSAVTPHTLKALPRERRVGEVVRLGDPRFGPEAGKLGLWHPGDFVERYGWGLFLPRPWDPGKTPVLLVHGAGGYPQEWARIVASLEGTRFQPLLFQYPSALRLPAVVDALDDMMAELRDRYAFRDVVVVAHSMGGLVARKAVAAGAGRWAEDVRLLVTIATPWGGVDAARTGLVDSPVVVPSWVDVSPDSPFLRALRRTPLPAGARSALFFGYQRGRSLLSQESSDRTVSLRSVLEPEAQAEAAVVRGFDEDHDSILTSDAVVAELRRLMIEAVPARP